MIPMGNKAQPMNKAVKEFAHMFNLSYDSPAVLKLESSLRHKWLEELPQEVFQACRSVREKEGEDHFRAAIINARRQLSMNKRQAAIEKVVEIYMFAFQREGVCLHCNGTVQALFLKSHITENYSLILSCTYCGLIHEITSRNKSLLVK